jgi:hypothetical protein
MADEDDSGDSAAKALLAAPVSTSRLPVARSLADAAPGEMVFVDRRGQSLTPRQVTAVKARFWAAVAAGGVAVGLGYGALMGPIGGVIAGVAIALMALFTMRHWPAYRTALAQLAAYQWEEAHASLLALDRRRLLPEQRPTVQSLLATVEALLGQPQQALDRIERVQADLRIWKRSGRVLRCQVVSIRAAALATLGRFDDARRARDELVREVAAVTGASGRPRGDYLEMLVQSIEIKLAADADTPDALPDDDTLHRWARAALGRSRFGEMLVGLAWAFHRRGDDDMARHLLAEAPSRIPRSSLAQTSPRLDAWAKESARAWGID